MSTVSADGQEDAKPPRSHRSSSILSERRSRSCSGTRKTRRSASRPGPSVVHYHLTLQNCESINIHVPGDSDDYVAVTGALQEDLLRDLKRLSWVEEKGNPHEPLVQQLDKLTRCSSDLSQPENDDIFDHQSSPVSSGRTSLLSDRARHQKRSRQQNNCAIADQPELLSARDLGRAVSCPSDSGNVCMPNSAGRNIQLPLESQGTRPRSYVGTGVSGVSPTVSRQSSSSKTGRQPETTADNGQCKTNSGSQTDSNSEPKDSHSRPVAVVQPRLKPSRAPRGQRSQARVHRSPSADTAADHYQASAQAISASVTADLDLQLAVHNLSDEVGRQRETVQAMTPPSRRRGRQIQRMPVTYRGKHHYF